jgi:uncharacterized RDD family membrane protein YckC
VELDDRITIATPEGVSVTLQLAGLGSRSIAGVADLTIQLLILLVLALITGVTTAGGISAVVFVIGAFIVWFGYPVLFEVLNSGQTPGKRWSHLRVVRDSGTAVDLQASAIRNLMRLVDGLLLLYIPSIIGIAVTRLNQRPGDIAAGTIVIRDAVGARGASAHAGRTVEPSDGAGWDVSAITPQELAAVRQFLERRDTLERTARAQLAARLAGGLREKVAGAPAGIAPERFLETLAHEKSRRG